jgi:hypothetical protein
LYYSSISHCQDWHWVTEIWRPFCSKSEALSCVVEAMPVQQFFWIRKSVYKGWEPPPSCPLLSTVDVLCSSYPDLLQLDQIIIIVEWLFRLLDYFWFVSKPPIFSKWRWKPSLVKVSILEPKLQCRPSAHVTWKSTFATTTKLMLRGKGEGPQKNLGTGRPTVFNAHLFINHSNVQFPTERSECIYDRKLTKFCPQKNHIWWSKFKPLHCTIWNLKITTNYYICIVWHQIDKICHKKNHNWALVWPLQGPGVKF